MSLESIEAALEGHNKLLAGLMEKINWYPIFTVDATIRRGERLAMNWIARRIRPWDGKDPEPSWIQNAGIAIEDLYPDEFARHANGEFWTGSGITEHTIPAAVIDAAMLSDFGPEWWHRIALDGRTLSQWHHECHRPHPGGRVHVVDLDRRELETDAVPWVGWIGQCGKCLSVYWAKED